jgi:hypothetical protein
VEIPAATKQRLDLDAERSWIVANEVNQFIWPGVDLRPIARGASRFDYGQLPLGLYLQLRDRVLALARAGRVTVTARTE